MTPTTLETFLSTVGSIVTAAIGWVGDFTAMIVAEPLLMVFFALPIVGLGIGLIRRIIQG